jgi:hypothetical protein
MPLHDLSLGLSHSFLRSSFPNKMLYAFLIFFLGATIPAHVILLGFMTPTTVATDTNYEALKTPWLESACILYRPTERPPLVGEVSTNFSG